MRSIDVLGALSIAADLALGLRAGHGVRATYIGMQLAEQLGLSPQEKIDLFYAELLIDAGCTAWASQMAVAILGDEIAARRDLFFFRDREDPRDMLRWLAGYMAAGERIDQRLRRSLQFAVQGRDFMVEGLRNTAETAARMARRLDRSLGTQQALRFAFEHWNGSGPYERSAASIPLVSRIVHATIFLEVLHQFGGREAAIQLSCAKRGKTIDPDVVDAFLQLAERPAFWDGLEDDDVWLHVRDLEPASPSQYLQADRLDDVAQAFADFADLKSVYSAGHSRRVAALAETIARHQDVPDSDVATIRCAGLLHDLGLVAVPSFILHKPDDKLGIAESDTLRLHPHHAERILSRVPAFAAACPIVAAHHERPDGNGYPRGMRGEQSPIGARVLAVADAFDELTHRRPEGDALPPVEALHLMAAESGTRFDRQAVDALARTLDVPLAIHATRARAEWPAGLTDREVDVLRALATGASRRAIAEQLVVSEHTVRHHLEHIYAKLAVGTRVEATLFALEHDLLS